MTTAMLRIAGFFMLLVLAIELTPLPANAQRLPPKQCLNCKNEVPGTSKVGDICPHCGVKWEFDFSGYSRRKFDPNKIKLPEFQPKKEKRAGTQVTTMPASVIVRVPEQATVEIEGRKMKSTGEERYYVTPSIVLNHPYSYSVKATWKEGDKEIVREREITIFAGTETYVDLRPQKKSDIKGLTEFEPAWITVKVPDDAVIEINGRRTRSTGPVRTFETPPLEVGTTYHYTIRMTYTEGGKKVSRLRRIQFRPGEETIIDLRPSGL